MAHRRIAVFSSHLSPAGPTPSGVAQRSPEPDEPPCVATSSCSAGDAESQRDGEAGCIFCRIIRGESPAFKLYEDDVCICILDSNPLTSGHSLIIPKSHSPSLESTSPSVIASMCSKIPFLSNCIMQATQCGRLLFKETHLHIIPRKAGDQLWPSESFQRQPIESNQEIVDLVNSVRDLVSSRS
ncbi:hypothetical protein ZIOFF_065931 [Zingiber officinale]|uniref:HIT domain-containing protein n=1 Tax=Zingiber officinale TaxID=94328 RepID=A0A8J5K929_ZINOF|nr:hypothetical protein ZIOFF_065931 [Zingiber officinale]